MGNAADYFCRVPIPLPSYVHEVTTWCEAIDDMKTWCYINYGDEWGYDQHGFWFKTDADAHWFRLRWT